jgi:hypothetical protein
MLAARISVSSVLSASVGQAAAQGMSLHISQGFSRETK